MIDTKLITFLTLLEEKSYTNTAKRLFITQPAVTHHIKSLEKEYDIILFSNPKTFELTKAGQTLLEYAKGLKTNEEFLLNSLKRQDCFSCNIGFTSMFKSVVPQASEIKKLFDRLPIFSAYIKSYDDLIADLLNGTLDFAFVDNSFDSQYFESILLTTEKIVLVGSPNGQYKGKDRITKEQMAMATIVSTNENTGLEKAVDASLKAKNTKLNNNYIAKTNDPELMKKLILLTDGLAFMYYDSVKKEIESGELKKFDFLNLQIQQNLYMIYNKSFGLSDKLKDFVDVIAKLGR